MKLLVLAPEAVGPQEIRGALGDGDLQDAEVRVVAPALQESGLAFWMSDSDEAIAEAREKAQRSVESLREAGVSASGDTGESDPLVAVQDALATYPADRVVVFVHPGDDQRYREDELAAQAQERFGVPVTVASLG